MTENMLTVYIYPFIDGIIKGDIVKGKWNLKKIYILLFLYLLRNIALFSLHAKQVANRVRPSITLSNFVSMTEFFVSNQLHFR
jgi:hypothetical protein